MINDIRVRYMDMPPSVCGFTLKVDACSYDIYINPAMSYEKQRETYQHELKHIYNDDFLLDDVNIAERSE